MTTHNDPATSGPAQTSVENVPTSEPPDYGSVGEGFGTVSGSTYQIDFDHQRVRRLANARGRSPVRHQGPDRQWQTYVGVEVVAWPLEYAPCLALRFWWQPTPFEDTYLVTSPITSATPRVQEFLDASIPIDLDLS